MIIAVAAVPVLAGLGGVIYYTKNQSEGAKCTNCNYIIRESNLNDFQLQKKASLAATLNYNNIKCMKCGDEARWTAL
jgi:hypothetical protein